MHGKHALRQALAVSGLSVIGRDKWGVFPLRGKARGLRKWSPELELWIVVVCCGSGMAVEHSKIQG